jgi:hypothetical protein
MRRYYGVETRSFEEAVEGRSGSIENSFYAKQLAAYFGLFSRDQIFVAIYEETVADPVTGLRSIFSFLGVDPDVQIPAQTIETRVNVTREAGSRGFLAKLRRKLQHRFPGAAAGDAPRPPPLKPETRQRLLALYREDIARLETLIGRDLSLWR